MRLSDVVIILVVGASACGGATDEGKAVLASLRSERIWSDLPVGGSRAAFSSPEKCRPHEETAIVLRVDIGRQDVEMGTAHYADLLVATGWTISKEVMHGEATTIEAEKNTGDGAVGVKVSGWRESGRIEVRGSPISAC